VLDSRAFKRHLEHYDLPPGARAQVFTRVEDYREHLDKELSEMRNSEMWRDGAAVRALRPENRRRG
jgi:hypothetical protein